MKTIQVSKVTFLSSLAQFSSVISVKKIEIWKTNACRQPWQCNENTRRGSLSRSELHIHTYIWQESSKMPHVYRIQMKESGENDIIPMLITIILFIRNRFYFSDQFTGKWRTKIRIKVCFLLCLLFPKTNVFVTHS